MQEIFKFLSQYWQVILFGVLAVIIVVLLIVKGRPIQDILSNIYDYCIYAINRFECPGDGVKKKALVMDFVKASLRNLFPGINVDKYDNVISSIIEKILTTPQKKGE